MLSNISTIKKLLLLTLFILGTKLSGINSEFPTVDESKIAKIDSIPDHLNDTSINENHIEPPYLNNKSSRKGFYNKKDKSVAKKKIKKSNKSNKKILEEVEKHFSYSNTDSLINEETIKFTTHKKQLISPDENDFTDIESLDSFKDMDLNFQSMHLSPDQEVLHNNMRRKYRNGFNSYRHSTYHNDNVPKKKYNKSKLKSHLNDTKDSIIPKVKKEFDIDFKVRAKKHDDLNDMSDLDAFVKSGGKQFRSISKRKAKNELDLMMKEQQIPSIDSMINMINKMQRKSVNIKKAKYFPKNEKLKKYKRQSTKSKKNIQKEINVTAHRNMKTSINGGNVESVIPKTNLNDTQDERPVDIQATNGNTDLIAQNSL